MNRIENYKNISQQNDRIYYNIVIPHNLNGGFSPAIYQEQLNQAILNNPSDYYMSVIRFSIPGGNIPLIIPDIQPYPNTDVNKTIFSVTLTYNVFTSSQIFVEFVPDDESLQPTPLTPQSPLPTTNGYYFLYTYTSFLNMINTALSNAFIALGIASGGLPVGSLAPYFQFDPINERISLVAQVAFYDETLANPIKIYMNYQLFSLLDGLPSVFQGYSAPTGSDFLLVVKNNHDNFYNPSNVTPVYPPLYYIMTQEYPTLADLNSFKSLALTSNLLPIKPEYIPRPKSSNQSVINTQGYLKNFEPLVVLGPESRTVIQYQADGPYQLIDLTSNTPLTKIDVSVFWFDVYGNQYLVDIPYNQVLTIKMVFIKKSTYYGYQ
jgi:hypothetical protein